MNYEAKWGIMVNGSDQIGKCSDVIKSVNGQVAQIKNSLYLTGSPSVLHKIKSELQNCINSIETCYDRTTAIKNLLSDSANTYKTNERRLAGTLIHSVGYNSFISGIIGTGDTQISWISLLPILFPGITIPGAILGGIITASWSSIVTGGNTGGSVFKLENSDGSAGLYGLGYEFEDEGWNKKSISAYLGKAKAEYSNDDFYAGVNAYVGKAEAEYDLKFNWFKAVTKDGKDELTFLDARAKAGASVSGLAGDFDVHAGDDMFGGKVKGEGAFGYAAAEGDLRANIGTDGVNVYAKGEAMAAAADGEIKGTFNFLGIEVTGKLEGYAGAVGAEGAIGIKDNKFVLEGGIAAVIGGGAGIEIGFNDTGWKEFGKGVGDFMGDVGEGISDAANAFGKGVSDTVDWLTWWDN